MGKTICAVIVTYNRKEYLLKLLSSLRSQSRKLDGILILDNHSSDGTDQLLLEKGIVADIQEEKLTATENLYYYRSATNSGGSGGFYRAMELAVKLGFDAIWCMDDDVCPEVNCLENLEKELTPDSRVVIPTRSDDRFQDRATVSVNMSNPFRYTNFLRKSFIDDACIVGNTIEIEDMPFEGPLICSSLVREIGLPNKDLFILFDDSDYAYRAKAKTKLLYCKTAVLHKQIIPVNNKGALMGWKDYYNCRNQIWFNRTYGKNIFVRILRPRLLIWDLYLRAIVRRKWSNFRVLHRAYRDGMANRLGKLVEPGTQGPDF